MHRAFPIADLTVGFLAAAAIALLNAADKLVALALSPHCSLTLPRNSFQLPLT